jgi:hypothetical protein
MRLLTIALSLASLCYSASWDKDYGPITIYTFELSSGTGGGIGGLPVFPGPLRYYTLMYIRVADLNVTALRLRVTQSDERGGIVKTTRLVEVANGFAAVSLDGPLGTILTRPVVELLRDSGTIDTAAQ